MTEQNHAYEQAGSQLESIVEMVAALDCDFDRLETLENEMADWNEDSTVQPWSIANPDDAAELAELRAAAGECKNADEARERIQEDALEVQVRDDWHSVGETDNTPQEFYILLCTGGPAVRIMGELDEHQQPSRAWIEYQDWSTPWTEYHGAHDSAALLTYCQQFFFGE
jgi:hypothetical protein